MFVKTFICYINRPLDYGLWYPYDSSFVIVGYSHAEWARNI